MKNRKGFTLIEMLVVIAIIAVLVAVVIPTVSSMKEKSKAATDAANLHIVYGVANATLVGKDIDIALPEIKKNCTDCVSFPDAKLCVVFDAPTFVDVYYVDGSNYYDIDYFSEVATTGEGTPKAKPDIPGAEWYNITDGVKVE